MDEGAEAALAKLYAEAGQLEGEWVPDIPEVAAERREVVDALTEAQLAAALNR